jgi:diguanylate cyclase (GGDEF)-like protein
MSGPNVTADMQSEMLDTLRPKVGEIAIGTTVLVILAYLAWHVTYQTFFLWWAGIAVFVALLRLGLGAAYAKTTNPSAIHKWSVAFTCGCWMAGALWGAGNVVLLLHRETGLQLMLISGQAGAVNATATRRFVSPAASIGLALLVLIPTIVIALVRYNIYFGFFACMSLSYLVATIKEIARAGEQSIAMMQARAENASLVTRLSEVNQVLRESNVALADLSMTDELTGIANRRHFMEVLKRRLQESMDRDEAVALLSVDVDYFKAYNDRYGHPAGDVCLRRLAQAMRLVVRGEEDLAARIGGEEFTILLACSATEEATLIARRLIEAVANMNIKHEASAHQHVTVSIGVISAIASPSRDNDWFMERADLALYEAKSRGRNQSCTATRLIGLLGHTTYSPVSDPHRRAGFASSGTAPSAGLFNPLN